MRVSIHTELSYRFAEPTHAVARIEVARTPDQTILAEDLIVEPFIELAVDDLGQTGRVLRGVLEGDVTVRYTATVDTGGRLLLPTSGRQLGWSELPADTLPFLQASRFCPSDTLGRFAQRQFGGAGDGVARVMAVLDWMTEHVDYVSGASDAETTAERTFVNRAGVCRDFTHLGITLCRALGVPARAVSAYAFALEPPDFHAIFEVFLEDRWWLIDPTRLAPIEGIARISSGRDAADIAFLTTDKACTMISQTVNVTRA